MAEIIDATAHMTLGEIRERDKDNIQLIMVNACKEMAFIELKHALVFIGKAINKALLDLGIDQKKLYDEYVQKPFGKNLRKMIKKQKDKPVSLHHANLPFTGEKGKLLKKVDELMAQKDVKVERRQYTNQKDAWRSGVYIYHANEIAYFISEAYRRKGGHYATPHIIVPALGKYFVLTNVKGVE